MTELHDDIRKRIRDLITLKFEGWGEAWTDDESGDRLANVAADAVMPVVDPIVTARDAAVELLNGARTALRHAEDKATDRLHDLVATRRDLVAARQQLDQVRKLHYNDGDGCCAEDGYVQPCRTVALLDAPARPAEYDEGGQ
jgi:hypothetical protein